jgi:hypothetical protein
MMTDPASGKTFKSTKLEIRSGGYILNLGDMEIWDGADLALLRETMTYLFEEERCRSFGVDLTYVKYVPSGFFGMLFDWQEKGVCIRLASPLPHVRRMLWFTQFFRAISDNLYELCPNLNPPLLAPESVNSAKSTAVQSLHAVNS